MYVNLKHDLVIKPALNSYVITTLHQPPFLCSPNIRSLLQRLPLTIDEFDSSDRKALSRLIQVGLVCEEESAITRRLKLVELPKDLLDSYESAECSWFQFVPDRIEIELTMKCNFRCIHCAWEAGEEATHELTAEEITEVIQEADTLGVGCLAITGGEPLIHPEIDRILRSLHNVAAVVVLATNGWFLHDHKDQISEAVDVVQISLHGASPEIHDWFVQHNGAFHRAVEAATLAKQLGKHVTLAHCICQENITEYEKMFPLAKSLGVDEVRFMRVFNTGRAKSMQRLSMLESFEIAKRLRSLKTEYQLAIQGGGFDVEELNELEKDCTWHGCPAGRTLLSIAVDGNVTCCTNIKDTLGEVGKQSLLDIWHCSKLRRLRQRNPYCGTCQLVATCGGPCRAPLRDPYGAIPISTELHQCPSDL